MELIQKTVLRIMTTGTTTGCTGTCRVIIPDTGATYNFKLLLNQEIKNVGFFDAYPLSGITGTAITYVPYVVTGQCTSRLLELRKYSVTDVFANQYFGNGNYIVDGVDYSNSISGISVVYFLGGIRYVDLLTGSTSGSTFSFTSLGYTNPNFINKPIYQDPNKENIISNPKISDDVFIVRQELSAFDGNYRLEFIKNLIDLETYAAGNFFNIVKNT
jgi:hypothetical protein